jgi:hydrogenase expression/formation protein HypD
VRFVDEFADPALAEALLAEIERRVTRRWSIMEICGGQTHSIIRHGLDQLLPSEIGLVHGPGCPVCVTSLETIDRALAITRDPRVVLCTFGDMMRVPGSGEDLMSARARGADARIVYSPLDALSVAESEPDREVVFLAVGFETTAPATAMAAREARRRGVGNFSMLVSHVLVPPAIEALMAAPDTRVDAFLAAGHVCTVMGTRQYESLAGALRVPIVITGFEPLDLLDGIRRAVTQLEGGRFELENAYARAVRAEGNEPARAMIDEVFEVVDRRWRGLGVLAASGWALRDDYAPLDAERRFGVGSLEVEEPEQCRAGDVLRGVITPDQCPAFGRECSPRRPLGAPMVSSEGACAAYHRYRGVTP